jgi:lipopolysaccharide export LptBFGC system permease protein LptF
MFKKPFAIVSLHYLAWFLGITLAFVLQLVLSVKEFRFEEPVQATMCLKYLLLNLAWIVSLSLPLSALFGSSSAYASGPFKKKVQQIHNAGKTPFSRLAGYCTPAVALGFCVALICLVMCLFVVPYANLRISRLTELMKTGTIAPDNPMSDREMSVGQLLEQAKQISLESSQANRQLKTELDAKRNQLMVEVYKKFALPLLGFLLPILGGLVALVLSKRRSGQRLILFLFDILLLVLIWTLLIAGEIWGDRGILSPFVSMFMTPAIATVIIVALTNRCSEILESPEAVQR